MTASGEVPLLLHFRISHYNEKVRWALDFKRWPHRRRAQIPGFHRVPVLLATRQTMLPVLMLDGKPLCGSNHILEEIERRRPDPPLFPKDPGDRARALEIERYFDEEVAPALRRLFWSCYLHRPRDCARMATHGASPLAGRAWLAVAPVFIPLLRRHMKADPESVSQARERLGSYFDRLESEIGPSGFLVGDSFGLADLCAAAVMTAILRPPEFPYPLPEPWPPELVELRESVSPRRGFQWVMDMYRKHRPASCEVS